MSSDTSLVDKESITLGRYLYATFDLIKRGLSYITQQSSASASSSDIAQPSLTNKLEYTSGSLPPSISTRIEPGKDIFPILSTINPKKSKNTYNVILADVSEITSRPVYKVPSIKTSSSFKSSLTTSSSYVNVPLLPNKPQMETTPITTSSSYINVPLLPNEPQIETTPFTTSSSYFPIQVGSQCNITTSSLTPDVVIQVWTTASHYVAGTTIANTSLSAQTYTANLKLFTDLLTSLHTNPNCQNTALNIMNFYYTSGGFSIPTINNNLNDPENNYYDQGRIEVILTYVQMTATYVICNTNITIDKTISGNLLTWYNDLHRRFYYRLHNVENNLRLVWIMYVFLNFLINSNPVSAYAEQILVLERYFSGSYNRNVNGANIPYVLNYNGNYVLTTENRADRTFSYHNYYLRILLSLLVFIKSLGIPIKYDIIKPSINAVVTTFTSPDAYNVYASYSGSPTQIATPSAYDIQLVRNLYDYVFNNNNLPNHKLMIYNVTSDLFVRALQSQRLT